MELNLDEIMNTFAGTVECQLSGHSGDLRLLAEAANIKSILIDTILHM